MEITVFGAVMPERTTFRRNQLSLSSELMKCFTLSMQESGSSRNFCICLRDNAISHTRRR
jgi:hypothetical protein